MGPLSLDIAAAALRPVQFDSEVPDLQGGIKLTYDDFKGVQTVGQTGTNLASAAIGVSGGVRRFRLPINTSAAANTESVEGNIVAADILIPVIPASTRKAWALTVLGEGALSSGAPDVYQSLTGGAGVGTPPGSTSASYAKVADIDPGAVGWSTATGQLKTVDWRTFIVSGQFYLPPQGNLWLAGAYSNSYSDNIGEFGSKTSTWGHEVWWDANLFCDVTPVTRLGLEFFQFTQTYLNT